MAAPIVPLQLVQIGLEAVRGTAVPATQVLDFTPGQASLKRDPGTIRIRNAGSLATAHRSYAGKDAISIDIGGPVTYQWLATWLNLFLGPLAAGAGAGADKTYAFDSTVVSDTADNLKSATLEVGGRDAWPSEYQVAGVMGQKLSIAIAQGKEWTYKAALLGRAVTPQAKTAALSQLATLVDVLGTTTKVYVDSALAFGTTQKVGDVVSADIEIDLGTEARYTLDGARNPFRVGVVKPRTVKAKIVVEYDAQAAYTATHAATAQRIRVASTGPTLGGSAYRAQFDLPGVWDAHVLADNNGVVVEELSLAGQYDATPAADIAAVVVCDRATVP